MVKFFYPAPKYCSLHIGLFLLQVPRLPCQLGDKELSQCFHTRCDIKLAKLILISYINREIMNTTASKLSRVLRSFTQRKNHMSAMMSYFWSLAPVSPTTFTYPCQFTFILILPNTSPSELFTLIMVIITSWSIENVSLRYELQEQGIVFALSSDDLMLLTNWFKHQKKIILADSCDNNLRNFVIHFLSRCCKHIDGASFWLL